MAKCHQRQCWVAAIPLAAKPTRSDSNGILAGPLFASCSIESDKGQSMADTPTDVRQILYRLAAVSSRPRYAFMVLNLISEVADPHGKAGPVIGSGPEATTVRDWLSDALAPLASQRRRAALAARVTAQVADGAPDSATLAEAVRLQARLSGKTNVSRAVSDLVRTGLVRRHYQGWRTNHANRGGGRQVVYTVEAEALVALRRRSHLI